jgi:hypothetical protein
MEKIEEFDLDDVCDTPKEESRSLTLWVPAEYKDKFDRIQARSGRKFGKYLKKLLIQSIDKVKLEDAS